MEQLHVIKIGGNVIDDETRLSSFLQLLTTVAGKKILVHGGGKLATRVAEQLNIPQQMIEGRRITDAETLKIVSMVYAGYINKNIVADLQKNGCNAIGLSGADGNAILAHKRKHEQIDYGFVGDVDEVNHTLFTDLLTTGLTPVICSISHDRQGTLLNTNADTIAQEIAKAMIGSYNVSLIYCFEKDGVLRNMNDKSSVISSINAEQFGLLKEENAIYAGMLPKLENAFAALNAGVKKVVIGKAEKLGGLIDGNHGTTLVK